MDQQHQVHEYETDLFDLFEMLWDGRWIISTFVALTTIFGSGYLLSKDTVYESEILLSLHNTPPTFSKQTNQADFLYSEFKRSFFSEKVFEAWKKNEHDVSLESEDLDLTNAIDGFVVSKDRLERTISLVPAKHNRAIVVIRAGETSMAFVVFKYISYVNELMTKEYAKQATNALQQLRPWTERPSRDVVEVSLVLDRFVYSAAKGAKVFQVQRPTMPSKVSPRTAAIFALSVVFGFAIGGVFVIFQNGLKRRRERRSKA